MAGHGDIEARIKEALREQANEAPLDPGRWGSSVTRSSPRGHRWLGTIVVASVAAATLVTSLSLLLPLGRDNSRPVLPADVVTADCQASDGFTPSIQPDWGATEEVFTISGAIPTGGGEGGGAGTPTDRITAWWNLSPKDWTSAVSANGEPRPAVADQMVLPLATVEPGPCSYRMEARVPDVDPGRYPIVVLYGGTDLGGRSWARFEAVHFNVTPTIAIGCPPEPGPWTDTDCPEVAWIHRVIQRAGYRITGGTKRAILVEQPVDPRFAAWQIHVQVLPTSLADALGRVPNADAEYEEINSQSGARVWSNGLAYSWDRGGVRVWVLPGPGDTSFPPEAVYALVHASGEVPPAFPN